MFDNPADELTHSFSRLVTSKPADVMRVTTPKQAQASIGRFLKAGLAVNFRGAGHSFGDQCISDGGGLVLNALAAPVEALAEGRFRLSTGQTWLAVEKALNAHGRSFPVLTNWLQVTVGGTLAYGGFGGASFSYGSQADNVEALQLIDGEGVLRVIDPVTPLWQVATCTAGRLGFVTECTVRTLPLQPYIEIARQVLDRPEDLAERLLYEAARLDPHEMLWGQVSASAIELYAARRSDSARPQGGLLPVAGQSIAWDAWLERHSHRDFSDSQAYVWADYVVPQARFPDFLRAAHALAFDPPEAAGWRPRMRVLCVDRDRAPPSAQYLAMGRVGGDGDVYGVGVYLEPDADDAALVARARTVLRRLLDLCIGYGGRPYLASWHELTEETAQTAFGDDWRAAREALALGSAGPRINPGSHPPL